MREQLQEFVRQTIDQLLDSLPHEELRKRLSLEERLEGLTAEDLIRTLSPETLEALKRQLKTNGEPPKPE
jgi:hypothetical protein